MVHKLGNPKFTDSYSYRDLDVGQYAKAFEECQEEEDRLRCESEVRKGMARAESGRYEDMLDDAHKFFAALDRDERELFARRNPDMFKRIQEYGRIQELNKFTKVEVDNKMEFD